MTEPTKKGSEPPAIEKDTTTVTPPVDDPNVPVEVDTPYKKEQREAQKAQDAFNKALESAEPLGTSSRSAEENKTGVAKEFDGSAHPTIVGDTEYEIDPTTGKPKTLYGSNQWVVESQIIGEQEKPGIGNMLGLLFSLIFDLADRGKRDHAILALRFLFPPEKRAKDPTVQERYERTVEAIDNPKDPLRDMTGDEIAEELGLQDVFNQKSLLRPDLLQAVTGESAEAVRKRGILDDIIEEVELYNQTADVKIDPYFHANQLYQESWHFQDPPPSNPKHPDVVGFAQMKVATVNGFLRNNPEVQEIIGKTSVTAEDLLDRDLSTKISVHLMGHYTEEWGSQFAGAFVYNAGVGKDGEGVISRITTQMGLDRNPTINEIIQFYQKDRERIDGKYENGDYDNDPKGAEGRWSSTWAVESFEYGILAYSPAWVLMGVIENPHQDAMKTPFNADDAKAKMEALGLPLPTEDAPDVAPLPTPSPTPAPGNN